MSNTLIRHLTKSSIALKYLIFERIRRSIVLSDYFMIFPYLLNSKKNQPICLSHNTTDLKGTSFLEIKLLSNTLLLKLEAS